MKLTKQKLKEIIMEELQAVHEGDRGDRHWASNPNNPLYSPVDSREEQASAINKIAHMLLNTGLDPKDASVWEMVKDAVDQSGGVFPRAE